MKDSDPFDAAAAQCLDKIVELVRAAGPVEHLTDKYFSHTRRIAEADDGGRVTYAIFMRRRVIAALEPVIRIVQSLVPDATVKRYFEEGDIVPSEKKLMEVEGPFAALSEVETLLLQKVGVPCVCADNAYDMCRAVPAAAFLDMHARHAPGPETNLLAAYGAAVGSRAAQEKDPEVRGFIGSSQDLTAPFFGQTRGMGTMPHALVGYTEGDVVAALKLLVEAVPEAQSIIALVDYDGKEISDSLRAAHWFYEEAKLQDTGRTFGVRLDTHGGRFTEGLDYEKSVDTVGAWLDTAGEYNIVEHVLGERAVQLDSGNILVDRVRRILFGSGVSVANIIHTRNALDKAGYTDATIVASSGFNAQKCQIAGAARAPIDVIGTGSFLPTTLGETYATADIIKYDGEKRVKVGREFLYD
ncbi:MAG: hypothetical protein AAGA88_04275 [Pseudomonadota bacterium]